MDLILKRAALATITVAGAVFTVLGVFAVVLLFQVSGAVENASQDEHTIAVQANKDEQAIAAKAMMLLDKAGATFDKINAPCTGFHGSVTCGTLAQVDQTAKNFGIVAGQTTEQVKQSGLLIEAATQNMNTVGYHVSDVADSLKGTAQATTAAVHQATMDLATANSVIASSQPLIAHLNDVATSANTAVLDFDAAEKDPNWSIVLKRAAEIMTSGSSIMATTDSIEKKLAECTLHPRLSCSLKSDVIFGAQVAGYILSVLH